MPVLPRRIWPGGAVHNAHIRQLSAECRAIGFVIITVQISWPACWRQSVQNLVRQPQSCWMFGYLYMQQLAATDVHHHKSIKAPECRGSHTDHVDGDDAVEVIINKATPASAGPCAARDHIFGNRRLCDDPAKLQQFGMNARCAPLGIFKAEPTNSSSKFGIYLRSPAARSALEAPIYFPNLTMPHAQTLRQ
jgi:hypothetical protein